MDKEKVESLEQRLENSKIRADRLSDELRCRTPTKQGRDQTNDADLQQAFETVRQSSYNNSIPKQNAMCIKYILCSTLRLDVMSIPVDHIFQMRNSI